MINLKLPDNVAGAISALKDNNFQAFLVGGSVRDLLMGKITTNWDFTTDCPPEEILKFFETAIFASLFDQTISEGQLAKFASRFMAMEKSDENIRKSLSNLQIEKLRVSHSTLARKQLNSQIGVLALLN